jgi:hypothetical protein
MPMAPRLATSLALCAVAGLAPVLLARAQAIPAVPAVGSGFQTVTPPKGSAFVVGQVVDGTTGRPIGGAVVTMTITTTMSTPGNQPQTPSRGIPMRGATPAAGSGQPQPQQMQLTNAARVLADGEGRFLFHDLPAGRVSLSATAGGYSTGNYGLKRPTDSARTITLTDGERFQEATVRLWKLASVTGTVLDEMGEPLVGVNVSFLRFQNANGVRRTVGGPATTTDDRGSFHFSTSYGDFLIVVPATSTSVSATSIDMFQRAMSAPTGSDEFMRNLSSSGAPTPNSNGMRVGTMQFQPPGGMGRNTPPVGADGVIRTYQTTYYPAAFTPSQAQVITLAPGEDRTNVDLTMRLTTTSRVMGQVSSPDGANGNIGIKLIVADSHDANFNGNYPAANTLSDPNGAFTFLGVPPGQYEVQVTKVPRPEIMNGQPPPPGTITPPTLWARVPVSVGAGDVAGVNVALRLGARLSGRIEFEGNVAPRPTPDRLSQVNINLQDLDNQGQPSLATRVGPDGQFTTQGVLPGHYLLTVNGNVGQGWSLRSASANGKDYSVSPQLIEGDVTNVLLTFTDHPNHLEGTVQVPHPVADNPTVVVFFPANYQAWLANGTSGRASRAVSLDETGHFVFTGIPAGDYDFAAIPADLRNDWQDPKSLEAIARVATRVQISETDQKTIDLRPVTIR